MSKDVTYTNGVIACREKYLLKDKIFKLCESTPDEAFRILLESGFGNGVEVSSLYDYEKMTKADEDALDAFIREYSPSDSEAEYLLSPRDFHNAKAILKAGYLNSDVEKMLAPEGQVPVQEMMMAIRDGKLEIFNKYLEGAIRETLALFKENENVTGARIGSIFEKALYEHLSFVSKKNRLLKKLLTAKADMTNILIAARSQDREFAESMYVTGGKLDNKKLAEIFEADENTKDIFKDTPYSKFALKCVELRKAGMPLTQPEKIKESYETEYFSKKKYELERNQPFLYYVYRKRAEEANVRIVCVCLLADMNEQDIKKRLRAF